VPATSRVGHSTTDGYRSHPSQLPADSSR
jgi:hypothetical protein